MSPVQQSSLLPGDRLGPYTLDREIGSGGMAVVHLAHGGPDDREYDEVAVKVFRPHVVADPESRLRLNREVDALQRVKHRCVAQVLDHNLSGQRLYLVTEYVPGPSLDQRVNERGPLTPRQLLPVATGLGNALYAIHACGILHRDIKPGNVLIAPDGHPVLIDFGIAQAFDDARITQTGMVIGTPGFLAPELIRGESADWSADWWAWAATVAFASTGRRPFGKGPMESVLHRVCEGHADLESMDSRLRPLIAALLAPHPGSRPTPAEVMDGLARYQEGYDAWTARPGSATALGTSSVPSLSPPVPQALPQQFAAHPAQHQHGPAPQPHRPPPTQNAYRPPEPASARALALGLGCLITALGTGFPVVAAVAIVAVAVLLRAIAYADQSRRRAAMKSRARTPAATIGRAPLHLLRGLWVTACTTPLLALVATVSAAAGWVLGQVLTTFTDAPTRIIAPATFLMATLGAQVTMWSAWGGETVRAGAATTIRRILPHRGARTAVTVATFVAAAALVGFIVAGALPGSTWPFGMPAAVQPLFE